MNKPALYVENSVMSKLDAEYTLNKHMKLIQCNNNCMVGDVGCGPGNITFEKLLPLLPKSAKLIGFDLSLDHIEHAKNHYNDDPRISYHQLDITTDLIPREYVEKFDLVTSLDCLHFVGDQRKAIKNINKMVKAGGRIIINFARESILYDLYYHLYDNLKWRKYMNNLEGAVPKPQTAQYYKAVCEACGFENILCEDKEMRCYLSDKTAFDLLNAVSSFKIPQELQAQFVEAHLEYLERRDLLCYDAEGNKQYLFQYTTFVITAVKPCI